jgi:hypothetical protein
MEWQPIETAPRDGTPVRTAKMSEMLGIPIYPVMARFLDGHWTAEFGDDEWRPYEPQPTHWMPEPPQ